MYTILGKTDRMRPINVSAEQKTDQLARLLVDALGHEGALLQARTSHWDRVADTIRFLSGQTIRRF